MMKFMKRALSLLISAMLLLGCFALAEETPLLPIAIVSYDLTDEATTAALSALIEPKENALTRWERVVLSDGREAWVICQFDQTTMSNAWSRVIDAETQEVLQRIRPTPVSSLPRRPAGRAQRASTRCGAFRTRCCLTACTPWRPATANPSRAI